MGKCIYGNTVGSGGGLPKSYILETEDGAQLVGVLVGEETILTATDNDVRENLVYAGDKGLSIGTKVIPSYHTTAGYKLIMPNKAFTAPLPHLDKYNYTKLLAIICKFEGGVAKSVAAEKISVEDQIFMTNSSTAIATITKDDENKEINFGIINDSKNIYLLRFITYKEIE